MAANDVIEVCKSVFYEETEKLPEGTLACGEDLIRLAGEVYATIVFEGFKAYRDHLHDLNITDEEKQKRAIILLEYSSSVIQDKLEELMSREIPQHS